MTPPRELVSHVRGLVDTIGVQATARKLGIARQTIAAVLAGVPVRAGTVLVVARAMRWPGSDETSPRNAA